MSSLYGISVLTEQDSALVLRLIACLMRHRIGIVSVDWVESGKGALYEIDLLVRADADHVRRAVKQIGACVGVAEVDYGRSEGHAPGVMA